MRNIDTIFALASGSGKTAVKVFRISGDCARSVAAALHLDPLPPRTAVLRKIRHPLSGEEIDSGLALWFPGPASFTGEDCLEIQVHGGHAIEHAVLRMLGEIPNCRIAEPGEFAWRAFSHGKLDLTAVEGLADLIDADTDFQRRQALEQTNGRLFQLATNWRENLLSCLALVEGEIDFDDEADVPKQTWPDVAARIELVLAGLRSASQDFTRAEIIRHGFCVVILGPPNAGKSSLLNYLVSREAAIVTATPGTTRDIIEATLDLEGVAVVLVDTAGLHQSEDPVERIGMEKARARAANAQLILWLSPDPSQDQLPSGEAFEAPILVIRSKSDLGTDLGNANSDRLAVSTVSGQGIIELLAAIRERARSSLQTERPAVLTRARHLSAVAAATEALQAIGSDAANLELAAEELRRAAGHLETLFGRIDSEEVLGDIFSRFCIGK